jgi:hypothetical protein
MRLGWNPRQALADVDILALGHRIRLCFVPAGDLSEIDPDSWALSARVGTSGQASGRSRLHGNGRGAPVEEVSPKITFDGRLHVIAYRATLHVPTEVVVCREAAGRRAAAARHSARQPGAELLLAGRSAGHRLV